MFVRCSNSSYDILAGGTPKHTQTVTDTTQKETAIDKKAQLWNTDMSTSSNHTRAFVQCCHSKDMVASSRTLLSYHVCQKCNLFQTKIKLKLMFMINFTVMAKYMITIISLLFLYNEEFATHILHRPIACRWMDETCSFI